MQSSPVSITGAGRLAPALALLASLALAAGCSGSDTPLNNNNNTASDRCPAGYVLVPGGTFTMGVNAEEITDFDITWSPNMGPAHKVTLTSDFCMSKAEITVAQYRSCRSAGTCTGTGPVPMVQDAECNYSDTDTSRDNHPVSCLTWLQAREYCQAQGGDLGTNAQWTRAAQGDDRRFYPWGNDEPTCDRANYDVNGPSGQEENGKGCDETTTPPYTWPVGSKPAGASPYGILDMAGNVAELVLDCARSQQICDGELGCVDPLDMHCDDDSARFTIGGSSGTAWDFQIFNRGSTVSDYSPGVGVRCVTKPRDR